MRHTKTPWVLGIAASHNGSVCLLKGDEVVVAIQEERLLRYKRAFHPGSSGSLAISYCMEYAGIQPSDLSAIVLCAAPPNQVPGMDVSLNPMFQVVQNQIPIMKIGHHLGHAIGAFATSGFRDSALLVIDGAGSPWNDLSEEERSVVKPEQYQRHIRQGRGGVREIISIYYANGTSVVPLEKQISSLDLAMKVGMPQLWSIGALYAGVGYQIFDNEAEGVGKVMGLAPYGKPTIPVRDFYEIVDGEFIFHQTVPQMYLHSDRWPLRKEEYQNLSASAQVAIEEALIYLARRTREITGSPRLCYSGGVALNSVANEKLMRDGCFEEIFIMPAAEDSGTAIGAAYYGLWRITGQNTARKLGHDAVGRVYSSAQIEEAINSHPACKVSRPKDIIDRTVDLLCQGKIIGWFQGRSELGPRALGQRSLLCDPRVPEMKDTLNEKVKFREGFRPFAPAILLEQLHDWFESPETNCESPHMLRVMKFRDEKRTLVPAVVHVDGTGRVQTLTKEANGRFYDLVRRFYERTGTPILLNTSFNIAGEPIVETPDDALWCFLFTGIDYCVIEEFLIEKAQWYRSPLDLYVRIIADRISIDYPVNNNILDLAKATEAVPLPNYFISFHADRLIESEVKLKDYREVALRISAKKPWGNVFHVSNYYLFEIFKRIDGNRTGWEILKALRTELGTECDETTFSRILTNLRRASVIDFHRLPLNQSGDKSAAPRNYSLKQV